MKSSNSNIFESLQKPRIEPLASRMRPQNLQQYIGQEHILSQGRLLRRAILSDQLSSLIFYGPPGTGKTTLAQVIAQHTKSYFMVLNAVLSGLAQIRESIEEAKRRYALSSQKSILFIDEVHRFNKSQQDALLPHVENGTIILIGATTENPYFEVNKALVSRSRVFELKSLTTQDLEKVFDSVLNDKERGYGSINLSFSETAKQHLVQTCNGDARSLLNAIELAVEPELKTNEKEIRIQLSDAEESIQKRAVLYDKDGDAHYDIISAFIKSIRGSDPDAALYWMAKMLQGGEDPKFIFRRMIISASEDIGLAQPDCLNTVMNCAKAYDYVGLPEGRYHLAHACLHLCNAPKSNSLMGFFDAIATVNDQNENNDSVPNHLKDKSRDGKHLGHGKGYQYPHAYQDHWVAQQYLPNGLANKVFYQPSQQGDEKRVYQQIQARREITWAVLLEKQHQEISLSRNDPSFHHEWEQQSLDNFEQQMLWCRNLLIELSQIKRDDLILDFHAGSGLLTLEASRHVKEGGVHAITWTEKESDTLEKTTANLNKFDSPQIYQCSKGQLPQEDEFKSTVFNKVFFRHVWDQGVSIEESLKELQPQIKSDGLLISYDYIFSEEQTLSQTLMPLIKQDDETQLLDQLKKFEISYSSLEVNTSKIKKDSLLKIPHDWKLLDTQVHALEIKKVFSKKLIQKWFSKSSLFGRHLHKNYETQNIELIQNLCLKYLIETTINWKKTVLIHCLQRI